ncbi:MAG: NusG domain II-containing protein, partial [Oscillospiraceae bacterium]
MSAKPSMNCKPTLADGLVVLVILALALALGGWFWTQPQTGELTAVVSIDGTEVERVRLATLTDPHEETITDCPYPITLVFFSDGVAVTAADCPTQDCVHTGKITRAGQSIVCLPNRLIVELSGAPADFDVLV